MATAAHENDLSALRPEQCDAQRRPMHFIEGQRFDSAANTVTDPSSGKQVGAINRH